MKKFIRYIMLAVGIGLSAAIAYAGTNWGSVIAKHNGEAVNIMSIQDPFIDALRKISPKFEGLTGAKVTTDGFGYDPLHEKEILGCSQKDGQYDVLFIDGIWIGEFVDAGCIDPVEDIWKGTDPKLIAWDDYVESFSGQAVWDGKKQCLPVGAYWQMLHYRKDLFEKAGLKPPTTLKETLAAAKFFTNNKDFPGISGYAMNDRRGAAAGQQYFEWIYSNGGKPWVSNYPGSPKPYADQTSLLDSPASVSIVQFMKDMVPYGPKGVEQFAWDERFNSFAQGNVAMINAWSVQTPGLNDPKVSKVVGKWGVSMMPHADGAKSVPPVGGWLMCMNKHSTRKAAAWDFMRWFASPE